LAAFSSYVLALAKNSDEKHARIMLMKLTPGFVGFCSTGPQVHRGIFQFELLTSSTFDFPPHCKQNTLISIIQHCYIVPKYFAILD